MTLQQTLERAWQRIQQFSASEAGAKSLQGFNADWENLVRLQFGEPLAARPGGRWLDRGPTKL